MKNYNVGDFVLFDNQSYALIEKVEVNGSYVLRIGSRMIENVSFEKIESIRLSPSILKSAEFIQKKQVGEHWWYYQDYGVRILPKIDEPSHFEVEVSLKNEKGEITIYFLDYFDQLQEIYEKAFKTKLPTNFSYSM